MGMGRCCRSIVTLNAEKAFWSPWSKSSMVGNPCHWCFARPRAEVKGASVALWHHSRDPVIQRSSALIHSFTATKRPATHVLQLLTFPWHQQPSRNLNAHTSGRKQTGLLVNLSLDSEGRNDFLFNNGRLWLAAQGRRGVKGQVTDIWVGLSSFHAYLCHASFHEKCQNTLSELSFRRLKKWRGSQLQVGPHTNLLEAPRTKEDLLMVYKFLICLRFSDLSFLGFSLILSPHNTPENTSL